MIIDNKINRYSRPLARQTPSLNISVKIDDVGISLLVTGTGPHRLPVLRLGASAYQTPTRATDCDWLQNWGQGGKPDRSATNRHRTTERSAHAT